jgi:hypothetical protein
METAKKIILRGVSLGLGQHKEKKAVFSSSVDTCADLDNAVVLGRVYYGARQNVVS